MELAKTEVALLNRYFYFYIIDEGIVAEFLDSLIADGIKESTPTSECSMLSLEGLVESLACQVVCELDVASCAGISDELVEFISEGSPSEVSAIILTMTHIRSYVVEALKRVPAVKMATAILNATKQRDL